MMLWYECKKLWNRYSIMVLLVLLCLVHVGMILQDEYVRKNLISSNIEMKITSGFWMNSIEQTKTMLYEQISFKYPDFPKENIEQAYDAVMKHTPQSIGGDQGFRLLYRSMHFWKMLLPIFLVFLLSPVFTQEKENQMDEIVMTCRYGTSVLQRTKLFAGILSALVIFLMFLTLSILIAIWMYGLQGSRQPVQDFMTNLTPYAWNHLQYLCMSCFLSCVAVLGITCFMSCLSFLMKQTHLVILTGFLCCIIPNFYQGDMQGFIQLFPSSLIDSNSFLSRYDVMSIAGTFIQRFYVAFLFTAILIICTLVLYKSKMIAYGKRHIRGKEGAFHDSGIDQKRV